MACVGVWSRRFVQYLLSLAIQSNGPHGCSCSSFSFRLLFTDVIQIEESKLPRRCCSLTAMSKRTCCMNHPQKSTCGVLARLETSGSRSDVADLPGSRDYISYMISTLPRSASLLGPGHGILRLPGLLTSHRAPTY
ncbi:hypothetical protein B0T13DRAFT_110357 [Neurospora crassa]|nr:hypothetical protein B0T13DRAFT_110357 [Neurospora crassa]